MVYVDMIYLSEIHKYMFKHMFNYDNQNNHYPGRCLQDAHVH